MIRLLSVVALLDITGAAGIAAAEPQPPVQATGAAAPSSHERISGEFVYIGGEKEVAAWNAAIDKATDDMFFAIRRIARGRIRESTSIAQRVRIAFGNGNISVFAAGDPPAVSPDNGKPINHKSREGDAVKLSQQITADDRLTQTFVADNGGQTILYFSIQTGSATATGFTGQVDGLRIELMDGSVANINFEPFLVPSDAAACKKDGWKTLFRADQSAFTNQGDCVSYVNNGR